MSRAHRLLHWSVALATCFVWQYSYAQTLSLEQRQPLELVYADSIVPQDRHEMMLTTGGWFSRSSGTHDEMLTQKVEWGISDQLQISALVDVVHISSANGSSAKGVGDLEIGTRYTWAAVGSPFTHIAIAMDVRFPTGDPRRSLGEGAYTSSPSLLLSHEFRGGRYHVFSTDGLEFVLAHRNVGSMGEPHHSVFANSGIASRVGHGWAVGELSVTSNRWSGGTDTQIVLTPEYVWRLARRMELLLGVPVRLNSSTNLIGAVLKFTFELGGPKERSETKSAR